MSVLYHVTARWSGFPGSPGFTNLYFAAVDPISTGSTAAADSVRSLFDDLKGFLSSSVHVLVLPNVEQINEADGVLIDEFTLATPPADVVGTSASPYAGPSGMLLNWKTGSIVAGRRVRGRTFIVPMATNQYDSDGTITSGALAIAQTAVDAYRVRAGTTPMVWHRPTGGPPGTGGLGVAITSAVVSDKAVVLRSRRD